MIDDNGEMTKAAQPRILLDDTQAITGDPFIYLDTVTDQAATPFTTDTPLAYFINEGKAVNLGFDNNIIENQYTAMIASLHRAKKITQMFKLTENDIAELDHLVPVYVAKLGGYFYVNKVANYTGKGLTKVELIRL
jgi:hypothetical protein